MPDYPYNLTALKNADGLGDLLIAANTYTNEIVSMVIIVVLFSVILMTLIVKRQPIENAVAISSTVCGVLSLAMWWGLLLSTSVLLWIMLIMGLSTFATYLISRYF